MSQRHAQAAAVAILRMWGFEHEDFRKLFPETNWRRLAAKSEAWIHSYLTGGDPEEAYRRAR
jgi:hypothetical protein